MAVVAKDIYAGNSGTPITSPSIEWPITPSDTDELPFVTTQIVCEDAGTIAYKTKNGDGQSNFPVIIRTVSAGDVLNRRIKQVMVTGTTVTKIFGAT